MTTPRIAGVRLTDTGETTSALSDLALAAKTGQLVWRDLSYNHAPFMSNFGNGSTRAGPSPI